MKISTRGRYAVRILAELKKHPAEYISVSELSENQSISPKYLEKIIAMLVKSGFVESSRGAMGGYCLKADKNNCSVADILRATGDLPKLVPCLGNKASCNRVEFCESIGCWEKLTMLITNYLETITLDKLINKKF